MQNNNTANAMNIPAAQSSQSPHFTLYTANCVGDNMNCFYPHRMPITGTAVLKRAFMRDYVCAEYKDNRRSSANFITSDCIPMDLDNDHSDDPAEWISPDAVVKQFPDVTIAIHYSRNHMKIKNGKSPRPRFHVIFRCSQITSSKDYRALKERLCRAFPYFDENALDAGRFLFGTKEANCELYIGKDTIEECLEKYYPENDTASSDDLSEDFSMLRSIPEGRRNATLSRFAGKILKRFGKTEKAEQLFNDEAGKCDPPMAASELKAIWRSAVSFYDRISKNPEYVPPDQYVTEFSVLGREYERTDSSAFGRSRIRLSTIRSIVPMSDRRCCWPTLTVVIVSASLIRWAFSTMMVCAGENLNRWQPVLHRN